MKITFSRWEIAPKMFQVEVGILSAIHYIIHLTALSTKQLKMKIIIMGIHFNFATPPFPSSAWQMLCAECQMLDNWLSSIPSSICQAAQSICQAAQSICQACTKHLSSKYQAPIKHLSSICQASVKQLSSICQATVKLLSSICQATVKHLSSAWRKRWCNDTNLTHA